MGKKDIAKKAYRSFLNASTRVFGVPFTKKMDSRLRFQRKLSLDNPQTLADKVAWMELHTDQTVPARLTDKYEVRSFVRERGLENLLIPCCGGPWTDVREIDFNSLPESFVIKATHGCGMNLLVDDKASLNLDEARRTLNRWLHEDYPRSCIEPHYQLIEHRLYAEDMLHDAAGIVDYKFYCFYGEPKFILRVADRDTEEHLNLFDYHWKSLSEHIQNKPVISPTPEPPSQLAEMLNVSRRLSQGFDFVRVDLYDIHGSIFFGEMTFSPSASVFPNFDDEFVAQWGKELHLPIDK